MTTSPIQVSLIMLRGFKAIGLFKDEQDVLNSPTQSEMRPGDIKWDVPAMEGSPMTTVSILLLSA